MTTRPAYLAMSTVKVYLPSASVTEPSPRDEIPTDAAPSGEPADETFPLKTAFCAITGVATSAIPSDAAAST